MPLKALNGLAVVEFKLLETEKTSKLPKEVIK